MPSFARSHAVVIGIDAYTDGIPDLHTARRDADTLATLLETEHGYTAHRFLDRDATRECLLHLLHDHLPHAVGPDDRVVFYFAGHGLALDADGDRGPNGYLLPQDARRGEPDSYLHMPAVHEALTALPCRHMLIILDSCFSGAFRWSTTRAVLRALPKEIHRERFDRFIQDSAWQVITSASHDQLALDMMDSFGGRDESGDHSPFAEALFEGLNGAGDVVPASGGDGVITATELYLYIEERLQPATIEAGSRQTPGLWQLKKHDKGQFIFLAPGHELNLPPAPDLTYANNPYRGLESYDEAHEDLFFGREEAIAELTGHVGRHRLTVVLGASGTGKSSVVKAGLLPRLRKIEDDRWTVLPVVRPGAEPVQALAGAVAVLDTGLNVPSEADSFLGRVAAWCAAHPDERLVLVVDQLEELVTMCRSAETREAALKRLAVLLDRHPRQVRVVLTLRTDFEPPFADSPLGGLWNASRYVVRPMTHDELREVIEGPASRRVLYFDPPSLVDRLVEEVIQTPGGLPLLSFTLSEMYVRYVDRQGNDRSLTEADYEALGGVVGALRSRAEAEYAALDAAHRATMRRVMLRMVALEGGSVARRRVRRSELEYAVREENERVAAVVDRLTAARLVVEGGEQTGESFVEPAHDALVRAWGRLIDWIQAENWDRADKRRQDDLLFQRDLGHAAHQWARIDDEKAQRGLLWRDAARGVVLEALLEREEAELTKTTLSRGQRVARKWWKVHRAANRLWQGGGGPIARRSNWMNRQEVDFTWSSVRGRMALRLVVVTAVAVLVAALVSTLFFWRAASRKAEEVQATAALIAAQSHPDALIQALLLGELKDSSEPFGGFGTALSVANAAIPTAALRVDSPVRSLAFDASGRRIVTGLEDGTVRIWNADGTGEPVVFRMQAERDEYMRKGDLSRSLLPSVTGVAFSPSGDSIATGFENGTVRIWLVDNTTTPLASYTHKSDSTLPSRVTSVAFSASGDRLLAGFDDGTASIWNTDGTGLPVERHTGNPLPSPLDHPVTSVAFSPSGIGIATGFGDPVDLQSGNPVTSVAFSRSGNRIVTGSSDGTVRVWRASWPDVLAFLRAATTACLPINERVRYLGETTEEARNSYAACEEAHGRTAPHDE